MVKGVLIKRKDVYTQRVQRIKEERVKAYLLQSLEYSTQCLESGVTNLLLLIHRDKGETGDDLASELLCREVCLEGKKR